MLNVGQSGYSRFENLGKVGKMCTPLVVSEWNKRRLPLTPRANDK
jgi:hypothetical protein